MRKVVCGFVFLCAGCTAAATTPDYPVSCTKHHLETGEQIGEPVVIAPEDVTKARIGYGGAPSYITAEVDGEEIMISEKDPRWRWWCEKADS